MRHRKQNCQKLSVIFPDCKIIRVEQTTSTNCHLLRLSEKEQLPEGSIVVTDNQTCGRGVGGNSWESQQGANLNLSIILYPTSVKASEQFILSKAISLAVYDFLSKHLTSGVSVKWPNDVYVAEKKITGILIENFICGECVTKTIAGIGININQERFVSEAPNPVSLKQLTGKTYNLEKCLQTLHSCIAERYRIIMKDADSINSDYLQHLYRFGEPHQYIANGKVFEAVITGVNHYGMLEMTTTNGENRVFGFKEVSWMS